MWQSGCIIITCTMDGTRTATGNSVPFQLQISRENCPRAEYIEIKWLKTDFYGHFIEKNEIPLGQMLVGNWKLSLELSWINMV